MIKRILCLLIATITTFFCFAGCSSESSKIQTVFNKPVENNNEIVHNTEDLTIEDTNIKTTEATKPDVITLSYEYIKSDEYMSYGLITPSSANDNKKTPLIISLHGSGEVGCSEEVFGSKFVIKAMRDWELDGFDAYVLFPHLTKNTYGLSWNGTEHAKALFELIDYVVEKFNIDKNKIVIQGHSMGGHGCLYMAAYRPNFFSAVVPISPYNSEADLIKIIDMPFRCYVGNENYGEDLSSVKFTFGRLSGVFGENTIFQRDVSHAEIPVVAFTEDLNGDNKSDLIEWMLSQTKEQ